METLTFDQLRNEFFRHYQAGAYQQALELIEKWQAEMPAQTAVLFNWKLCAAALANDVDRALQILQKALDEGYFWPPEGLRRDPDLASLQDNATYQSMVTVCGERLEKARQAARPQLSVSLPQNDGGPCPLLLGFHGWGQLAEDFASHWQSLVEAGWIVAAAQSSQVVAKDTFVWDNLETAIGEAQAHYRQLCAQYPVDPRRVVVAGFSQGGGVALWLALTQKFPVRGFIGVGPYLDDVTTRTAPLGGAPVPGLRAYLVTGHQEQDNGMFASIEGVLGAHGIPYRRDNVAGTAHEFPADFPARLQNALAFLLE